MRQYGTGNSLLVDQPFDVGLESDGGSYGGFQLVLRERDDVGIGAVAEDDGLLFHRPVECADVIAQSRRAFVLLAARCVPHLAFERESAVLCAAAELVAPAFAPTLPIDHATRLAEWVARLTLSYLCCPSDHLDVHDAAQVRALVDDFVLPGFLRPAALEGITP